VRAYYVRAFRFFDPPATRRSHFDEFVKRGSPAAGIDIGVLTIPLKRAACGASRMKRLLASTIFGLCLLFCASDCLPGSAVEAAVTGPLLSKLTGKPPAISVGGKSADEIKAKIKSGRIKRVIPPRSLPDGVKETDDVEYGKGGGKPLLLDLFQPSENRQPVPGVIFVHGGSWSRGTRKVYHYYCEHFAKEGYVAATIEYRLSGAAPFPAAIQDVKCAIRWMRAHSTKLGIDPNKIGLVGGSAGGHLVLLAAYANNDDPELEGIGGYGGTSSRVQAVVDLYGPVQLKGRRTPSVVKFLGGKTSDEAPELYAKASPMTYLTKDAPPTLILHGTVDELVSITQSDQLAARLSKLGVPYLYDRQEGWHHGMDAVAEVNVRCVWFMDQFLTQVLPLPKSDAGR
jgi:acetyl esterase/lipase